MKFNVAKLPHKIAYSLNPDFAVRALGGYSLMAAASQPENFPESL